MWMAAAGTVLDRVLRTDRSRLQPDNSDAGLLSRFVKERDEAAFAELVRRHSALVWGVCRRVLAHDQDAEDATQATFIILARRAHEFRHASRLSTWLYSVAYHSARNVRKMKQRRLHHETHSVLQGQHTDARQQMWAFLEPVLDEELMRLPSKYQEPLVLCCLEGKTQAEAARLLGCPTGTVAARISRGRQQLRERLQKRGMIVSSVMLTSMMTSEAMAALVPSRMLEAAWAQNCLQALVTTQSLPATVQELISNDSWRELSRKLIYFAAGSTCVALATGGGWWLLRENAPASTTTTLESAVIQQNPRYVALPRNPQAVILKLTKQHVVTREPFQTVSLLADGTLKTMSKNLDKSQKLSALEVQQLMQLAVHDLQLLDLDSEKLWDSLHEEYDFDGNLRAANDTTETLIDVQTSTRQHHIAWEQLGSTEAWFHEKREVLALAEISRRLASYALVEQAGGREAVAQVCQQLNQLLRSTYPQKQPFQPHHLVHFTAAAGDSKASYSFSVGSKFIDKHFYAANCQVNDHGKLTLGTVIPGPSEKPPRFPKRAKSAEDSPVK